MDGESVYDVKFDAPCFIILGSESHGISAPVLQKAAKRITIPGRSGPESLNAAVAAGIIMDHASRQLGL
jgi:TrmH family RNA methyltransferase